MEKTESIKHLAAHALMTLPDSRSQSNDLLNSITTALPKDDAVRIEAQVQLRNLAAMDKAQQQFTLSYNGGTHEA